MKKFRKWCFLSLLAVLSTPLGTYAAENTKKDLLAYLDSISFAHSAFIQLHEDGSSLKGILKMERPDRMRFEYNPEHQLLVIIERGQVAIFDGEDAISPYQLPLKKSPFSIFLKHDLSFLYDNGIIINDFNLENIVIRVYDSLNSTEGFIDLTFSKSPVALLGWYVEDFNGEGTRVILEQLNTDITGFDKLTFSISAEIEKRRGLLSR